MDVKTLMIDLYTDTDLLARFKSDPTAVFKEKGGVVPPGVTFKVIEDTADTVHLVLPYLSDPEPLDAKDMTQRISMNSWGMPF